MYKNLIILGPSRSGKTALARLISEQYGCNIINLNDIKETYEKTFNKENDDNFKKFIINYIEQLTDYKTFYSDRKTIFECGFIDEEIYNNINQEKTAIIGISYDNITLDYFISIVKNSQSVDYLNYLPMDSLKYKLEELIKESKEMTKVFDTLDINYYDVSNDRNEAFNTIVEDVESITKYNSKFKVKK